VEKGSFTNSDKYRWIKKHGIWLIESTNESGQVTILPEGVIPSRAPCRYDSTPDYAKWKKAVESKGVESDQGEIAAR
jgi:hypothetical protein